MALFEYKILIFIKFYILLIYMSAPQPQPQPQFLVDFQDKMTKLNSVKQAIASSIDFKQKFSDELKTQISGINNKLQQLAGLINTLKSTASTLQGQIGTNSTAITDKENQIKALQGQITQLTKERDDLANQLNAQKASLQQEIDQRQKKIDDCEAQLLDITQKYSTETAKSTALEAQLKDSGDKNQQSLDQINKLTADSQKNLQDQAANLGQKITAYEQQIQTLEQQVQDKDNQIQQLHNTTTAGQTQLQGQIKNLEDEVQKLKNENSKLEQALNAATQAIDEAADDLKKLMDSVPNAQTKADIDGLINGLDNQIQQLINDLQNNPSQPATSSSTSSSVPQAQQVAPTNINMSTLQNTGLPNQYVQGSTGQVPQTSNPMPASVAKQKSFQKIPPTTIMTVPGYAGGPSKQMTLNDLRTELNNRAKKIPGDDKYERLLNQLNTATTEAQAQDMLNKSGISFKNNGLFGGRKTKKNRKQKGGFIYKSSSLRKKIPYTSKIPKYFRRSKSSKRYSS